MGMTRSILLLTLFLGTRSAWGQQMPEQVQESLGKLIGTWEIETTVGEQDISTIVTLAWSKDRNTVHYQAHGSSLKTAQANVTFSGILGWNGSQQAVTEHSYNSVGETMSAVHEIGDSSWTSKTKSVIFRDGKPVIEESLRVFNWDSQGHLKIEVTGRKQGGDSVPDQTYHFRPVARGSNATAVRLIKDSIIRWRKHWQAGNTKGLTDEFTPNGVRVLGRSLRPHVGTDAVARSFAAVIADNGDLADTSLTVDVRHARFIDSRHVIGDGTFIIRNAEGQVTKRGKWANLLIANEARTDIRLLMEAAFEELPLDAVADRELPAEGVALPAPVKLEDQPLQAMIERSIARYAAGVLSSDSELVAREFTLYGIRSVSEMPAAYRGRAAILDSLRIANEGSSPYAKTTLKAVTLGAKRLSDDLAMAHGLWQATNEKGEVIDYGQWGNVLRIRDGEVKLLQESAGSYLP